MKNKIIISILVICFFLNLINFGFLKTCFNFFILFLILFVLYKIYETWFFNSSTFISIKNRIQNHIHNCNELNKHIESLKSTYDSLEFEKENLGHADFVDTSNYNYKRQANKEKRKGNNICECSRAIVSKANQQPFRYLCKYFNIKANENTIQKFEILLNNLSAAENGKDLLLAEKEDILNHILPEIPFLIQTFSKEKLSNKLGFKFIDLSDSYFPQYSFQYISPGGNASYSTNITLNNEILENFIQYLANQLTFKNSVKGQRQLMTKSLRERIKIRDHHTCKLCNVSIKDEPHLLLEIDHILPLSKGGMTQEDNLQTLCWKCNRSKSNKLI